MAICLHLSFNGYLSAIKGNIVPYQPDYFTESHSCIIGDLATNFVILAIPAAAAFHQPCEIIMGNSLDAGLFRQLYAWHGLHRIPYCNAVHLDSMVEYGVQQGQPVTYRTICQALLCGQDMQYVGCRYLGDDLISNISKENRHAAERVFC